MHLDFVKYFSSGFGIEAVKVPLYCNEKKNYLTTVVLNEKTNRCYQHVTGKISVTMK